VPRDVEVQDPPAIVADDKKTIEYAEGDVRDGEEIHRGDGFPRVAQKCEPALDWLSVPRRSFHAARNRPLGNNKTQHEKFAMDAWRFPGRVLDDHLEDQLSNLLRGLSSSNWLPGFGNHPPIQMKTCTVPADYHFRCDDDEGVFQRVSIQTKID
jgi:hypothetical protein